MRVVRERRGQRGVVGTSHGELTCSCDIAKNDKGRGGACDFAAEQGEWLAGSTGS